MVRDISSPATPSPAGVAEELTIRFISLIAPGVRETRAVKKPSGSALTRKFWLKNVSGVTLTCTTAPARLRRPRTAMLSAPVVMRGKGGERSCSANWLAGLTSRNLFEPESKKATVSKSAGKTATGEDKAARSPLVSSESSPPPASVKTNPVSG